MPYPAGVDFRQPRPRERPSGLMAIGALLGAGLAADKLVGAGVGGILGGLLTKEVPVPLEKALRDSLAQRGANMISLYRRGPTQVQVLFNYQGQFWTIDSSAPFIAVQDDIDDWIFGDLIDYQFTRRVADIQQGQA